MPARCGSASPTRAAAAGRSPSPAASSCSRADTVVKAIGQRPRAEFARWIDGLELDARSIAVDPDRSTGNPKFFAAGDAVNGGASVVEAVREGKLAARGDPRVPRAGLA